MDTPGKLVDRLMSDIAAVADDIQRYVRRPGADFTRTRVLGAGDVIRALVCMGTGALEHELGGFLEAPRACTPSAFCQQRAKIDPEAFRRLLRLFQPGAEGRAPLARGLRLAAVDGTEVAMQRNPRDAETYSPNANGRSELGRNSVHATALLDMDAGAFLDAVVQPGPRKDEPAAFRELADSCDPGLTLVGDRGFASYNGFAHCLERGVGFVIRLTDAFAARLLGAEELPDGADEDVELLLTRSQSASARAQPGY
ncbi:MAG: transposase, partial [Coriobacteriaceae bacterium]|nr:transposase [Coriobacteriaceae bacterium]